MAVEKQVVSVRMDPDEYDRLRTTLGLPKGVRPTVVMLAAVARITGGTAPDLNGHAPGGRRPGAGRKPGRPAAA
ncbi:hypothetical protein [Streptomyces soliscabiei]|uniref:hypothetical protein n=1 Tax=Streptomyces soliscabiei TaxID=588897 RepID=UPI0029ACFF68|nr:hypothetical protein [Streptomyces sp. NY05-11A]MDX2683688.1 hypothetical protein [Streptomyces sp. NY05-11A]